METEQAVRDFFQAHKTKEPFKGKNLTNVQTLSGGFSNWVFRLEFDDSTTLVAKHFSDTMKFDKKVEALKQRYFVEKTALTLLNDQPWTKDHPDSIVRTPRVYFGDDEMLVLVMEDAGANTKTLLEHLKNDENLIKDETFLAQMARDIHILSQYLSEKSGITSKNHPKVLNDHAAMNLLRAKLGPAIGQWVQQVGIGKETEPYLKGMNMSLSSIEEEIAAQQSGNDQVFTIGDFWLNSILVNLERKLIYIVDWEHARIESNTRDLMQFMCNLWLVRQNEELFNAKSIDTMMKRLQFEFFGDENKDWRIHSGPAGGERFVGMVVGKSYFLGNFWGLKDYKNIILKAIAEFESLNA